MVKIVSQKSDPNFSSKSYSFFSFQSCIDMIIYPDFSPFIEQRLLIKVILINWCGLTEQILKGIPLSSYKTEWYWLKKLVKILTGVHCVHNWTYLYGTFKETIIIVFVNLVNSFLYIYSDTIPVVNVFLFITDYFESLPWCVKTTVDCDPLGNSWQDMMFIRTSVMSFSYK